MTFIPAFQGYQPTDIERDVAMALMTMWTNFAKTGSVFSLSLIEIESNFNFLKLLACIIYSNFRNKFSIGHPAGVGSLRKYHKCVEWIFYFSVQWHIESRFVRHICTSYFCVK